jgi:hypothetical protein
LPADSGGAKLFREPERRNGSMTRPSIGFIFVALFAGVFAACASTGSSSAGAGSASVTFAIDNNLSGLAGATVYLVRDSGTRRTVGMVQSGRRMEFSESVRPGTYYLVAGGVAGGDLESERFRLEAGNLVVSWDLRANVVRVGVRG